MKAYDKYDEFIYEKEAGKDYLYLEWELGNTCNYRCSYCTPYFYDGNMPWLDISNIDLFLKSLRKRYLNKDFIFHNLIGGEVTLWKVLPLFVEKIKKYNKKAYISLTTNGGRSPSYWAKYANLFNAFDISVHPEFAKKEQLTENIHIISDQVYDTHVMVSMVPEIWNQCMELAYYIRKNTKELSLVLSTMKKRINNTDLMDYTEEQKKTIKEWNANARKYSRYSTPSRKLKWRNSKNG